MATTSLDPQIHMEAVELFIKQLKVGILYDNIMLGYSYNYDDSIQLATPRGEMVTPTPQRHTPQGTSCTLMHSVTILILLDYCVVEH